MPCTPEEIALRTRFEATYARSQTPVMLAIERRVCGCDYGGNSWTTRVQADDMADRLRLGPGVELLDLGAGSGWPGIYFAETRGCAVTLADLPETGLWIAQRRAVESGLFDRVTTVVADAGALPFSDSSFDAISHSDLLCCLVHKDAVLDGCRRIIRPTGRMAFTVIAIAPTLSPAEYRRAVANGPDFIEAEADYPSLLARTGWDVAAHADLTEAYAESCARQIDADEAHAHDLRDLIGAEDYAERLQSWREKLAAIRDGLFRRDLFVVTPRPL